MFDTQLHDEHPVERLAPTDWASPEWDKATKVHDWKNYVPAYLQNAWGSMTRQHQFFVAAAFQEVADSEHWD